MAQTKYTYSIASDTANAKLAADSLKEEIGSSAIITALDYITALGDVLDVYMKDSLSAGDETILDGVVSAHTGVALAGEPQQVSVFGSKFEDDRFLIANNRIPSGYTIYPTGIADDISNGNYGAGNKLKLNSSTTSVEFQI